ncbi:MAG: tail fiber domain-containing protein [Patescibacteria group bacterium]|nr:tail fiber domain-containing protein [Patescibacteria group bacterium]
MVRGSGKILVTLWGVFFVSLVVFGFVSVRDYFGQNDLSGVADSSRRSLGDKENLSSVNYGNRDWNSFADSNPGLYYASGGLAITGKEVINGSLTGQDIAAGSITGSNLAGFWVTSVMIENGSIKGKDIDRKTITSSNLKSGEINSRIIKNGSITSRDLYSELTIGMLKIGEDVTSAYGLGDTGDLIVSGGLEVTEAAYFDSTLYVKGSTSISTLTSSTLATTTANISNILSNSDLYIKGRVPTSDDFFVSDFVTATINPSGVVSIGAIPVSFSSIDGTNDLYIVDDLEVGGTVYLSGNPTSNLEAATKAYVDAQVAAGTFLALTDTISSYNSGRLLFEGAAAVTDSASLKWNTAGSYLELPEIRALSASGLKLYDDGGNGIFVEDGGYVGIGTSDPGSILNIYQPDDEVGIRLNGYDDRSGSTMDIWIDSLGRSEIETSGNLILDSSTVSLMGDLKIANDVVIKTGGDNDYGFGYHSASDTWRLVDGDDLTANVRMTLDSSGYFGIGTTDPATTLDIRGNLAAGTNGTEFAVNTSGQVTAGTWTSTAIGTAYGGTNWNSGSASGMARVVNGSWGAVTGTTNYAAYWSDANTISAEQYLNVARGGTGAGTFTGVLKGNGTSAFTAMTGTANYVTRWTDANTLGIGKLYDSGTYVGIGTNNPVHALEFLAGTTAAEGLAFGTDVEIFRTAAGKLRITSTGLAVNNYLDIDLGQDYQWGVTLTAGGTGGSNLRYGSDAMIQNDYNLKIGSNSSARLRYDTTGGASEHVLRIETYVGGTSNYSGYLFLNENGDDRVPTTTAANPTFRIYSADMAQVDDYLELYHDQTNANIDWGNGSLNLIGGLVGIGTATPGEELHVQGDAKVSNLTVDGAVYSNSGVLTNVNPSDERLKKDINEMGNVLEDIMKLRPVTYRWKEGTDKETKRGFIAQELERVFPELVAPGRNGYKGIYSTDFIPYLIKAVQEQQIQIKSLGDSTAKKQIMEALDLKVVSLENEVEDINELIKDRDKKNDEYITKKELKSVAYWNFKTWTFLEDVLFKTKVAFEAPVRFLAQVTFGDRITFGDVDMAGQAVVHAGDKRVEVKFNKEYNQRPIVNLTAQNYYGGYTLKEITKQGFVIELEKTADKDIEFNWIALAVEGVEVHESEGRGEEKEAVDKESEAGAEQGKEGEQVEEPEDDEEAGDDEAGEAQEGEASGGGQETEDEDGSGADGEITGEGADDSDSENVEE